MTAIAEILRAIINKNIKVANQEMSNYLEFYKKDEFPKHEINAKIALDATFLVNYGRYLGFTIEYPSEYEDHIIKL
jgi:hypothetical protein